MAVHFRLLEISEHMDIPIPETGPWDVLYAIEDFANQELYIITCNYTMVMSLLFIVIANKKKKSIFCFLGYRPYQCTVCDKKFTIIGNLRTHERTHHSQFSIVNLTDSANVETAISRVDNARFELLNTNALQLPSTIFPWTPWLPLQY